MTKQELIDLGLSEENADKILKEHVPYDRFKQVNDDKKALETQLNERTQAIDELNKKLKAGEDTEKAIAELKEQITQKDAAIQATRKEAAINLALTKARARNAKAAIALLDTDKLELQEDGTLKGLTEALEGLQKTDAYLFETDDDTPAAGDSGGFNPAPNDKAEAVDFGQALVNYYQNQQK